jgi:hypothetical protein
VICPVGFAVTSTVSGTVVPDRSAASKSAWLTSLVALHVALAPGTRLATGGQAVAWPVTVTVTAVRPVADVVQVKSAGAGAGVKQIR